MCMWQAGLPAEAASCLVRAEEYAQAGDIYRRINQFSKVQECLDLVSKDD